jgi:hypothetical protein
MSTVTGFYVFNSVRRGYMLGGEVHTCVHILEELCVYFAVSAEYAMRAHVTVLAWDGRSYFGTVYTKAKIYIHGHMQSSKVLRLNSPLQNAAGRYDSPL